MFRSIVLLAICMSLFGCNIVSPVESSPHSSVEVTLSRYQKLMIIDKDVVVRFNLDISVDGVVEKFVTIVVSDGKVGVIN